MPSSTRSLIIGDLHCGALTGIAPPGAWLDKIKDKQKLVWDWYTATLETYGPFDSLLGMGDFVDGEGKKETIGTYITDTMEQAEVAAQVLKYAKVAPKATFLVRGTPLHSAGTYNYENPIADELNCQIQDEWYLNINGLKVSTRHTVGRSNTPYGQGTPVLKEVIRDLTEAVARGQEPADVVIRGHAHLSVEIRVSRRMGISAPCLQLPGSVYGRKCLGFGYDLGIGILDVEDRDNWQYRPILMPYTIVGTREYITI